MKKTSLVLLVAGIFLVLTAFSTMALARGPFFTGSIQGNLQEVSQTGKVNSYSNGLRCGFHRFSGSGETTLPCFGRGRRVEIWADALNLKVEEFVRLRQSGKSIAEIAAEKNLKLEDVIKKVLKAEKEYLEELVKEGKISRERANDLLEFKKQRLTDMAKSKVNGPYGKGYRGGGCFMGRI